MPDLTDRGVSVVSIGDEFVISGAGVPVREHHIGFLAMAHGNGVFAARWRFPAAIMKGGAGRTHWALRRGEAT